MKRFGFQLSRFFFASLLSWMIAIFSCVLFSCQKTNDSLGIQLNLEKKTLSNGLTVILVEDHTMPLVSFQTWFKVGSVNEKLGSTGVSHMFEHLMFQGIKKYPAQEIFKQLEAQGAEVSAFTNRDYSVFYHLIPSGLLEKVVDIESDRMSHLILNEEVLNKEKLIIFEERRLRGESSYDSQLQEALWQLAYRRHPYYQPVVGYPADWISMTLSQLQKHFKSYYQPRNATLVLVGDFKLAPTFKLIQRYYGEIPGRPRPKDEIPEEPEQNEERRLIIRERVISERFVQAYHIPSAQHDDAYALDVLATLLFEGKGSRAQKRLIQEKNLALSISGIAFTPSYPGLFLISCTLKSKLSSALAEAELDRLISEVQDHGVSEEELQFAARQLTFLLLDGVRSYYGLGQLMGTVQMILGDPMKFSKDLKKYAQVKSQDVQRVAQKYFDPNHRSIVILMPKSP